MTATGNYHGVGFKIKPGVTQATQYLILTDGLSEISMELRSEQVTLANIEKAIRVLGEKGMLSRPEWRGRGVS